MNRDCEISVPAGLVSCRLNGVQRHISAISENSLCLRTDETAEGTLEVCFRMPDGRWNRVFISDYHAGLVCRDCCGGLIRLSFSNRDYAGHFRRTMAFYTDYIRAFSEDDIQSLVDYPSYADESFGRSFDFSDLRLPEDREICISLHDPGLYDLYMNHSLQTFLRSYSREKGIPEIRQIHRLYIGNGFCRQLFPDNAALDTMLAKARSESLAATLVTAPDPGISGEILSRYSGEILVNDWGLLHRLQGYPGISPVLGTLLNKRRKDPRIGYKPDLNPDLLRRSSVNSPEYLAFLESFGVKRIEFECCNYEYELPDRDCSLHLPFYQTNTSVYCPIKALCEHGDRGRQSDDSGCPRYCLSNGLRYPSHLKMLSRWNSIFAADGCLADAFPGFNRLVLNL